MAKKQLKKTALQLIRDVVYQSQRLRPDKHEMLHDIKMMNFKIRPISGDVFAMAGHNVDFMESVWRIAKIEEIIGVALQSLEERELRAFFQYMDNLEDQLQKTITKTLHDAPADIGRGVEMVALEVFRERTSRRTIN